MSNASETEIERKFLVDAGAVAQLLAGNLLRGEYTRLDQGYLVNGPVSLRIRLFGGVESKAELTLKGPGEVTRYEKNVEIPVEYAHSLLRSCPTVIRKYRFRVGRWEIDKFLNVKDPETQELLWLAEIELESENASFDRPSWLGREVTSDLSYTNARLSERATKE